MPWFSRKTSDTGHPLPARFAVIDLETTGFSARGTDRIVEIAVITLDEFGNVEQKFESLVNPRRDPGPVRLHGIRPRDLDHAPEFREIAGHLVPLLGGRIVAGHNILFDLQFLEAEFKRAGLWLPDLDVCCTVQYSRRLVSAPNYRLSTVCATCGIVIRGEHAAGADAEAAAHLLRHLWNRRPDVRLFHSLVRRIQFGRAAWPDAEAVSTPVPRSSVPRTARPVLAELLDQIPVDGDETSPHVSAYLELLSRVLEDRRVTNEKLEELRRFAINSGISRKMIEDLHQAYFRTVIRAVLADHRVHPRELEDVRLIAELFGISDDAIHVDLQSERTRLNSGEIHATNVSEDLRGRSVCFTGESTLTYNGKPLTRQLAEQLASQAGLRVKSSVSKTLDFLVAADPYSESTKARRARELGVRVLAEDEFWRRLGIKVG